MPGKLQGKVALITGGNSGIGLESAKLFHSEGATVIITTRTQVSYEIAEKEFKGVFHVIQADVCDLQQLDNLYSQIKDKFGGLDILFANAGNFNKC
jgi:NAD(P)-dependent dehydrogenase (short-subunit alcohol dehydrogenase family)